MNIVLGVDIGGSHITAMLVDLETRKPIKTSLVRKSIDTQKAASSIISSWTSVIKKVMNYKTLSIERIGIAMPGPFDYNSGIAWMKDQSKFDSLYGLNIKKLIAESLQIEAANIRFLNDAESFLKGEVFSGVARNRSNVVGITLGTGLGSAICRNGHIKDADLWSSPFLDGIAEDYLSTRWFISRFFSLAGNEIKGVRELALLAQKNKAAKDTFREFGFNLSSFLLQIIEKEKPEAIVLGGSISKAFKLFDNELNMQLKELENRPFILKAKLGEESSLIGAASCWVDQEEDLPGETLKEFPVQLNS